MRVQRDRDHLTVRQTHEKVPTRSAGTRATGGTGGAGNRRRGRVGIGTAGHPTSSPPHPLVSGGTPRTTLPPRGVFSYPKLYAVRLRIRSVLDLHQLFSEAVIVVRSLYRRPGPPSRSVPPETRGWEGPRSILRLPRRPVVGAVGTPAGAPTTADGNTCHDALRARLLLTVPRSVLAACGHILPSERFCTVCSSVSPGSSGWTRRLLSPDAGAFSGEHACVGGDGYGSTRNEGEHNGRGRNHTRHR